jgi:propionyl-CoA synthetase
MMVRCRCHLARPCRIARRPVRVLGRAAEDIEWVRRPRAVWNDSDPLRPAWFPGAMLNTCYNAVDLHVAAGRGAQTALIYDSPVTGTQRSYSYAQLQDEVARLAGALLALGVERGDRVLIYMPMIPEAVFGMLACARIGAIHSVVFGGFAANELAQRIQHAAPRAVLTASCGIEPGRVVPYKPMLDDAITRSSAKPRHCLVLQRPQSVAALEPGRDVDWQSAVAGAAPATAVAVQATDPLYILYTSGTTGMPKGVVRDNGGHAVALKWSLRNVYGMSPGDVFWAASDIGWVVGHSYIVYAPLLLGCTTVLYEGKPVGTPDAGAFFRVIQEHRVNALFTAPTAIRAIKREDPRGELPKTLRHVLAAHALPRRRARRSRHRRVERARARRARDRSLVADRDRLADRRQLHGDRAGAGEARVAHARGARLRRARARRRRERAAARGDRSRGDQAAAAAGVPAHALGERRGLRAELSRSASRATTRRPTRVTSTRTAISGSWPAPTTSSTSRATACRRCDGRGDRRTPDVAECAVTGVADALKGQVPLGFVVLNAGAQRDPAELERELVARVREAIGPVAAFRRALVVPRLPKTRSGKVLRGTLRKIADAEPYRTPATIDDPAILDEIRTLLREAATASADAQRQRSRPELERRRPAREEPARGIRGGSISSGERRADRRGRRQQRRLARGGRRDGRNPPRGARAQSRLRRRVHDRRAARRDTSSCCCSTRTRAPSAEMLAPLCRAFDAPDTFAASPLVLDETGLVTGVTITVPYLGRGRVRYRSETAQSLASGTAEPLPWYTLFPSGGAVLVHRERFLALGGFDPLFHPFYYEDTDLGMRAWRRGWTCVVVPEGRVTHPDGGTIRRSFNASPHRGDPQAQPRALPHQEPDRIAGLRRPSGATGPPLAGAPGAAGRGRAARPARRAAALPGRARASPSRTRRRAALGARDLRADRRALAREQRA